MGTSFVVPAGLGFMVFALAMIGLNVAGLYDGVLGFLGQLSKSSSSRLRAAKSSSPMPTLPQCSIGWRCGRPRS